MNKKYPSIKIEVNDQQPLEDIVLLLEAKGYARKYTLNEDSKIVCTFEDGIFVDYIESTTDSSFKLTTIEELKKL